MPQLASAPGDAPGRGRDTDRHQAATSPPPAPVVLTTTPTSMRIALVASIGTALVSTVVASFVVLRRPEPAPATATAPSAAPTAPVDEASATSPAAAANLSADPAPASPPPSSEPRWPDLALDGLPSLEAAPPSMGQSVGSPRDGALLRADRLPPSRHYRIRDPETAWGTRNTIAHLRDAIAVVRRRNPQLHRLVIGDLSLHQGGPVDGHTSHQAGRDVDVGLFYRGHFEDGPVAFSEATRETLDRRATFDLIAALASTRDDPEGVELIVLDYNLQRLLRRAAEARGIDEELLEALFQFPHGPHSRHGLVRHKPAHRDHLHVRFRCPADDGYCRNPLIGFGGMQPSQTSGS